MEIVTLENNEKIDSIERYYSEKDIDIMEYWMVLQKNIWIIVTILFFSVFLYGWHLLTIPKTYLAEGSILAMNEQGGAISAALGGMPIPGIGGFSDTSDQLMVILESKTIALRVVEQLKIVDFLASRNDKSKKSFSLIPFIFSFLPSSDDTGIANPEYLKQKANDDAIRFLTQKTVFKQNKSGLLVIQVEWLTPAGSAEIVNTYLVSLSNFLNNYSIKLNYMVIDSAMPPTNKFKPKVALSLIIFTFGAFFITVFLVFIKETIFSNKKVDLS